MSTYLKELVGEESLVNILPPLYQGYWPKPILEGFVKELKDEAVGQKLLQGIRAIPFEDDFGISICTREEVETVIREVLEEDKVEEIISLFRQLFTLAVDLSLG